MGVDTGIIVFAFHACKSFCQSFGKQLVQGESTRTALRIRPLLASNSMHSNIVLQEGVPVLLLLLYSSLMPKNRCLIFLEIKINLER